MGPNRQPIYCHHPHQHPHSAAAAAHLHQQQHAQYHMQQQQLYAASQHGQHQNNQIYQQIPAVLNATTTASVQQPPPPTTSAAINHQSIYQSSSGPPIMTTSSGGIYSSNATMRRQQHPQNIYHQQPTQHQQPSLKPSPDTIEVPSSNTIDSAMYERDKQIYRCSTLRQGGKFDPKYKPSILNCPLPEIPKDADSPPKIESTIKEPVSNHYSKTLHRPPMKLPPPGKAIPPPKIDTPTSPPLLNSNGNQLSSQGQINNHTKSPPPMLNNRESPTINNTISKSDSIGQNGGGNGINPNDESNYAVTEL